MKFFRKTVLFVWLLGWLLANTDRIFAAMDTNAPPPVTALDFYNAGTKFLAHTNFTEAELMFQSALAAQDERVQTAALYNIGNARFGLGLEYLKKGPDAQKTMAQGNAALSRADQALQAADAAMATTNMSQLVSAYMEGRGARHELREAEKAVAAAMEMFGNTLRKWQRADSDYKSVVELDPANTNAIHNIEVVERAIAKLVDMAQQMQAMSASLAGKRGQIGQKLGKMRGQMPGFNAPPGVAGESDEDNDDITPGSLVGQKENPGREGGQLQVLLSPDEASQILNGLKIDETKRLPMDGSQEGKPRDRNGRTW